MSDSGHPLRLLHAFSTFALGGAQSRFARLVQALGDGYYHIVTAMDRRFDAADILKDNPNIEISDIPSTRGRNLNNVPRFVRALRHTRPARLVTYNFGAIEWAYANAFVRLPHLHVEDGFGPEENASRLLRRSIVRAVGLRLSGASLVTISHGLAEIGRREWKMPADRILLVPNGIDARSFTSGLGRQRHSRFAVNDEVVIGTVASLREEKRLDRLLHAFARLSAARDALLVIVGAGPQRTMLEALAHELGVAHKVLFEGHYDAVDRLYAEFDVFALSSDTEQMPLVVLEAMAAGLAIVATNVGDLPRMLAQSNLPWLVPLSDEALAGALREAIDAPARRASVGADNQRVVLSDFSAKRMYDDWRRLFDGERPVGAAPLPVDDRDATRSKSA